MRRQIILFLTLIVCVSVMLNVPGVAAQGGGAGATASGKGGAVATANTLATQVGLDILKKGGNAIDAAVATAAALGVVEPFSCGIGGGGFMVIYLKSADRVITIDGRETAPASATPDMFNDPDSTDHKPLVFSPNRISNGAAVGVPGTLLTWTEALNRYGTMSLKDLMAPGVTLAEQGFKVNKTFASFIDINKDRFAIFPATAAIYLKDGKVPEVGSTFTNPDIAKAYRLIMDQGTAAFYRGDIAKAIVATVQKPPTVDKPPFHVLSGGITLADLDYYHVNVRAPVMTIYRGYKVYGMGLPSSGGITGIETLNIAEGFDFSKMDTAQAWHSIIESERLAYADRGAYLGDPSFVDVPLTGLLSKDFATERRALISDKAMAGGKDARAKAGDPLKYQKDPSPSKTGNVLIQSMNDHEGMSTTHLTVADKDGNVVTYTFTIEQTGGSGIVVPGYGFLLNNELTDFDVPAPAPNSPEPGKRPRSSMSPMIVFAPDGRIMAFGSPGGSTIITTSLGIAFNLIDFNMPIDNAIAAPRISQRNGGVTQVDGGFEKTDVGKKLTDLGHVLDPSGGEIGAATGITINPDGTMLAAAEPVRRGGGSAMVVEPAK